MKIEKKQQRLIRKVEEYVDTIKSAGAVLILRKYEGKAITLARESFWYSLNTLGNYMQSESRKFKGTLGDYLARAGAEFVLDSIDSGLIKSDLYSRLNEIRDRIRA